MSGPALAAVASSHPAFVEVHALSMVSAGRLDELRLDPLLRVLGTHAVRAAIDRLHLHPGAGPA